MASSPIFNVELMTVGRRRRYFVVRVAYGVLMLLAMWICYESAISGLTVSLRESAEFAAKFFSTFSWIQLFAVMFLTPAMIAGTIASEHERRTIDYLLTTQLGDAEIALGKFAARMWAVFALLMTGLPILAIAMCMGGIAPRELFESFAVALLTLLSVGSLSIAVSARTRKAREAVTRTFVIVIGAMLIPTLAVSIGFYLQFEAGGTWLATAGDWMASVGQKGVMLNPFVFLFSNLFDAPSRYRFGFWTFAAFHGGVAAACCLWSVWSVRRFYLRFQGSPIRGAEPPVKPRAMPRVMPATAIPAEAIPVGEAILVGEAIPLGEAGQVVDGVSVEDEAPVDDTAAVDEADTVAAGAVGASVPGRTRLRGLLDAGRPMWWKERIAQRTLGRLGWGARIATVLLYGGAWFWLAVVVYYNFKMSDVFQADRWQSPVMFFAAGAAPTFGCFAMLLATARAAGSITAEREQDTWVTLISTPLEGEEIIRAKMLGAAFSVRNWYVLIGATWFCCVLFHPTFLAAMPALIFAYVLGLWFSVTLGTYFSLCYRTSIKAIGSALAVLVLGTGIAPLIAAMLVQELEPTAFSLPVVLSMPHVAAMDYAEGSQLGGRFSGYLVLAVIATIGYCGATIALYQACRGRFDELAGRTTRGSGAPAALPARRTGPAVGELPAIPLAEPETETPEGRPPGERPSG